MGSNWGKQKETLVTTYKTVCRLLLSYAAPVWSPLCNGSNFYYAKTQYYIYITAPDRLHLETNILLAKDHNVMWDDYKAVCISVSSEQSTLQGLNEKTQTT